MWGEAPAKKSLGQHFLVDVGAIRRIVETGVAAALPVVEIGPGRGALTDSLQERAPQLVLVEKDRALAAHHREQRPAVRVIESDVLDVTEQDLGIDGLYAVVSNLPYNAAGRITMHIGEQWLRAKRLTLMYQLEVARRISGCAGDDAYGAVSVMVQNLFTVLPLFDLGPGAFRPPPKVRSGVVLLLRRERPLADGLDPGRLHTLVHTAFQARRKVLSNALRPLIGGADAMAWIEAAGLSARSRPEEVPPERWIELLRRWPEATSKPPP